MLYLQLDNCVKENKNQYILWLLALLVELKIFEKVKSCVLLPAFILGDVLPGINELGQTFGQTIDISQ